MNPAWLFGAAGLVFTLVTYAIGWGVFRQKVEELRACTIELKTRISKLEADMGLIAETRKDVAVLTERFSGFQALAERDGRELRHDISGMKMALEAMAKELRDRRGG